MCKRSLLTWSILMLLSKNAAARSTVVRSPTANQGGAKDASVAPMPGPVVSQARPRDGSRMTLEAQESINESVFALAALKIVMLFEPAAHISGKTAHGSVPVSAR